ncbi:MAG: roadblock/LC7 domain-containing protein [Candidatus Hodarchaeales archaeon]
MVFDVKQFDSILTKVVNAEPGIKKVILVDRTGLTIAHVSRSSYYPVDVDGIGVIASAVFCASEEQGNNLSLGDLGMVTSEFDTGKIFATSSGRGVLCVITEAQISLGMVRHVMNRAKQELADKLDEFLAAQSSLTGGVMTDVQVPTKPSLKKEELEAALRELEKF